VARVLRDYPYFAGLDLAERLWIAALEADAAGVPAEINAAIRESAEWIERVPVWSGERLTAEV
jgi:hypothetical protein